MYSFDPEAPLEFYWEIDRRLNSRRIKRGQRSLLKLAVEDVDRSIILVLPAWQRRFVRKFTEYDGRIVRIGWRF